MAPDAAVSAAARARPALLASLIAGLSMRTMAHRLSAAALLVLAGQACAGRSPTAGPDVSDAAADFASWADGAATDGAATDGAVTDSASGGEEVDANEVAADALGGLPAPDVATDSAVSDAAPADVATTCPLYQPYEGTPCAVPADAMCGFHPACCCYQGKFVCVAIEEYRCVKGTWTHIANDLCMRGPPSCADGWYGDSKADAPTDPPDAAQAPAGDVAADDEGGSS